MRLSKPAALAAAVAAGLVATVLLPPSPASAATAEFHAASTWSTGYVGMMTVRNDEAAPLTSWRVEFDLPPGTTIDNYWSTQVVRDRNHYVFTSQPWNSHVPPAGSVTFGFVARGTGTPFNCTVNDAPCAGTGPVGRDVTPPTTPANARSSISPDGLTLLWDPATDDRGVVAYEVFSNGRLLATTTGTSHSMPTPPPMVFAFGIRAVDAAGNLSPFALVGLGTPEDTRAPTAPTDLRTGGPSQGYFELTWAASADDVMVSGYEVYLNDVLVSRVGGTSGVVPYRGYGEYIFEVRAFDAAGNFSPFVWIGLAVDPPPPTIPPTPR